MRGISFLGLLGLTLLMGCGSDPDPGPGGPGSSGGNATGGAATGGTGAGGSTGGNGETGGNGGDGSGGNTGGQGTGGDVIEPDLPEGSSQTEYAVNLVDAEIEQFLIDFITQPNDLDAEDRDPDQLRALEVPSRIFYQYFKDEYDFLFFISPEELDVSLNGLHQSVHSRTMPGTGVTKYSHPEYHGSDGTLMSAIGFVFRSYDQRPPFAHEVMHHYGQHLDDSLGFGDDFTGGKASHWGTTSVDGVLGGFNGESLRCKTPADGMPPDCTAEADGRVHYVVDAFSPLSSSGLNDSKGYAPLELYMMGLVAADEIPQSYTILDDAAPEPLDIDPETRRMTIDASGMSQVTVDDIIAVHGPTRLRPMDRRTFRGALVVLSKNPVGDEFMAAASNWAASFGGVNETAEWPSFETLTGGLARFDMRIGGARAEDEPIVLPEPFEPMCDVYAQDCSDGLACYDHEDPVCIPPGLGQIGDPCGDTYDCDLGLDCSISASGFSCAPYCDPLDMSSSVACDDLCPGAFTEVIGTVTDDAGELDFETIGGLCHGGAGTGSCDPLNQEECGDGLGCFGREATTCQPEGDLTLGEVCVPLGVVCEAGTTCIGIQGEDAYCQPYCDHVGSGDNSCATLCPGGAWEFGDTYSICIPE